MNWVNVIGVALGAGVVAFALLRVERRALWAVVVLLLAPGGLAVARWASVGGHWPETALGLALAAGAAGLWWYGPGRRMPRPNSDSIKVWGQESAPRPSREQTAALQREVERLREEQARLEAEVRRLRGGNGKSEK
jgi:hypothetical protein